MQKLTVSISDTASSNSPTASLTEPSDSRYEGIFISKTSQSPPSNSIPAASIYGGASVSAPAQPETLADSPANFIPAPVEAATDSSNWAPSVQTLLDQPPSTLPQRLVAGGMLFCVAFGAWATLGEIDEVGHAQGRLIPKGETYKIDPVDMGKVANIAVKEGQSVKTGQVLVELDAKIAAGEVDRLQQIVNAARVEFSQKQTLLEKAYLDARTRTQIAEANAQSQKAAIARANARAASVREMIQQEQMVAKAIEDRIKRLQPLTATARELLEQRRADVVAQQERIDRLKPLLAEGAISKEAVFQAEQSLRDRQSAIIQSELAESANVKERLFEVQQSLRDRQNSITLNQGELQQAIAEAARLQAELAQKQAEGRKTQIEAQQQIQQLKVETTQLNAKIAETKNLLASAKTKLQERFLYAPVDGVVSSLNIPNKGQVVQPGETLAEIAPHGAPLVLSASLPNREAGFVKAGMPVQVKLDAYPYQDYGVISGKVISVSPDAKANQQIGSVYRVEVALERNYVTGDRGRISFKAGQTANADIIIRRRRLADILLDPIRQLQTGGLNL